MKAVSSLLIVCASNPTLPLLSTHGELEPEGYGASAQDAHNYARKRCTQQHQIGRKHVTVKQEYDKQLYKKALISSMSLVPLRPSTSKGHQATPTTNS